MSKSVFANPEAIAKLENWYRQFEAKIGRPTESRSVPTAIGPAHVLVTGPSDAPPLIVLHGSLASSAHICCELGPLLDRFRIYAIDLPGQSVRAPEVRLDVKGNGLPSFVLEVADGLGLSHFNLLGVSWGGFVASRTAALGPDKVQRLVLLVPAGFVMGSPWQGTIHAILPILAYRRSQSRKHLDKFVNAMFTTPDEDWTRYMGDTFTSFALNFAIPPNATAETFRNWKNPTLVIAAERDMSFPGDKLLNRVKTLIPQAETELIKDCLHLLPTTNEFRQWMAGRVSSFLSSD